LEQRLEFLKKEIQAAASRKTEAVETERPLGDCIVGSREDSVFQNRFPEPDFKEIRVRRNNENPIPNLQFFWLA
jgi:hypothetical protein